MKRPRYLIGLGVLVAALALTALACGGGGNKDANATKTAAYQTPEATQPAAETPLASQTPSADAYTITTTGGVLTDPDGKTLYTFDNDTATTSACGTDCTPTWPPLTTSGTYTADPSLTGTIGTITRDDGTKQVKYSGKPLYHYSGDSVAGDKNGDGIGGVWHVALP